MAKFVLDMEKYAALARQAAAEGCVLLENKKETLPIKKGTRISVFGRIAFHYYKSGTGSGGLVNTKYVVGILDALKGCEDIKLNETLMGLYEHWIEEHPFNKGAGWGQEPWSQEEMPLTDAVVSDAAGVSDMAVVVIGRTAGEDQDAKAEPGSYLLTAAEEDMLSKVCSAFERVAVVLNVGNIIDMKWVDKYRPTAVLYAWQGGQEGGSGVLDALLGRVNPCGHLSDTIAANIGDYPSTENFGDAERNFYKEDIFVGYRYFETFAKEKVLYPFGYGLSYTTFEQLPVSFCVTEDGVSVEVLVKNTGHYSGKAVVQLYVSAPQGCLGKPSRELKAYEKTDALAPGQEQLVTLTVDRTAFASYDDSGCTGHKSCYVLEQGDYEIYVGSNVRDAVLAGVFEVMETCVTEQLTECLAPVQAFERMKAQAVADSAAGTAAGCGAVAADAGSCGEMDADVERPVALTTEPVPTRTVNPMDKAASRRPAGIAYTGDQGYKLADVYDEKIDMDTFIAQLSDEDLTCIVRGEGMCSPKVTPGTAGAFGGVTESLAHFGIPVGCCADGPSGIRMDCGSQAFSLPNGTALGCTFNKQLVADLYEMEGLELRKNRVDTLLGPGINIHRNPLNGRNFEYISEDPYLTGTMAAAQIRGMGRAGVTGTIKHFAGNNQEFHRRNVDAIVSERALREIYLKGFEMAVKDGGAYSVMTTYGPVNGIWTAGNYDLVTAILRDEWGFDGIAMTDWWADMNDEGQPASQKNTTAMVRAQNDLFMVVPDSAANSMKDNSMEGLASGAVTRGEFQRSAANICRMLMRSPVMDRYLGRTPEDDMEILGDAQDTAGAGFECTYYDIAEDTVLDIADMCTDMGHSEVFGINVEKMGMYALTATMSTEASELAQINVSVFYDNQLKGTMALKGTSETPVTQTVDLGVVFGKTHYIKLYFSMSGLKLHELRIHKTGDFKMPF